VRRHVILVGLPGAGKTTVGRRVAELLPTDYTDFTDIDEVVEAESGWSISRIFAEQGEEEFRRLERSVMDRALAAPPHLIAAGGGWIAQPGNLEAARERGAAVLYLRVAPALAAGRLGDDATRPLLAGKDRRGTLEALLAGREDWYRRADAVVEASGEPEAVAEAVAARVRELASE